MVQDIGVNANKVDEDVRRKGKENNCSVQATRWLTRLIMSWRIFLLVMIVRGHAHRKRSKRKKLNELRRCDAAMPS